MGRVDLAVCDPDLVRAQIAPVFQDYARYLLTIRQAIGSATSRGSVTSPGIVTRRSGRLVDLIASLPGGLDTRLGKASRTEQISRSGNGSDWPSRGHCSVTPRWSSWTSPQRRSTPTAKRSSSICCSRSVEDRIVVFVSHRFATVRSADVVCARSRRSGRDGHTRRADERQGLYNDLFTCRPIATDSLTDGPRLGGEEWS